ncbi:MAG TPA: hypothetical protein VGX25_31205 [Actinophytocola sp.]|uniref:sacsin N-terminal ATP-binding-like domain-containing protein n=1 Tax=Actinophytocola sp. TaxID=1872138 RepID=UPI002DDD0100|nr:hypothetical protein [Actinophytocola sp.]HEV2783877.1 hypothetical protein [Actinophytocola sp.]
MSADPFGTAALRESVLAGWRSSPTRFREDANAEEDLYLGGYRDRLLVELAQNAADAAMTAGVAGVLRVSIVDGELRAANTGALLDADGVAALASLRASAKHSGHVVGRFGVGFAAVLTVSDAPRVVSRSGGVEFSAARTAEELAAVPELSARVADRGGRVPVLRLAWPVPETEPGPPDGFDTEVRLPLRSDVDGQALLAGFADQIVDLLLSLTGLGRIEIGSSGWERAETDGRVELHGPSGVGHWLVCRRSGELSAEVTSRLGVEARTRPHWTVCWAVPISGDGRPRPLESDVLHAPTPTDERMSLPARLIATLPIEPSRRRLAPGPAADAVLAEAARSYPDLVRRLEPVDRTELVPRPDFPLSEVDGRLRDLVLDELRAARWLPPAGEDRDEVRPAGATVLDLPAPGLADLLADAVPGLLDGALAGPEHAKALAALGVPRLRPAGVIEAVTGIDRPPSWWRQLYEALSPLAELDAGVREELGGLPVPLLDGHTLPGPRGALLVDELLDELSDMDLGLRVVHPDAAHPLLLRLGARRGGPEDLLDSPPLRDAVERSLDDVESGVDITGLVDAVLRLVSEVSARPGERPWLGALALPDAAGDRRRADELALPGSAFLDLLAGDSPLGVLADSVAKAWPPTVLTAVGVLDSFATVDDEEPAGPDHDLPDEAEWWDSLAEPPTRVLAVRDLDLIADDAWPRALRLLAGDPVTWPALRQPGGYTSWWIGNNAVLAGAAPRFWRLPGAGALAGLYDPVPDVGLPESVLAAIGVRGALDDVDASDLLARLGDPRREIPPGVLLRAYATLAGADPAEVDPPDRVRTLTGDVRAAEDCAVLDEPWLLGLVPDDRLVCAGDDFTLAPALAELLDLPLASETVQLTVDSAGEWVGWAELGAVVAACDLLGLEVPDGGLLVHDEPTAPPWWVDRDGAVHASDSADALARALAWLTDRWADRHILAALITDPEPGSYLA